MGAAIAAHLANAGLRVRLLDIPAKDAPAGDRAARNKIAAAGLEGARKAKPAAFFSPRFDTLVSVGNLEDDLAAAVAASDVIIEAIIENLAIKQKLYARIDEMGGRAIITSNTSGLRIADLMQGRSADFRGRFCITHFFNPPRYLKLVEIVAGADTKPETLARAEALCGGLLGKGLVRAKDTPNFIANRIGTFAMMRTLGEAVAKGYTVEEVDMVFGPATGRPEERRLPHRRRRRPGHAAARDQQLLRRAARRRAARRVRALARPAAADRQEVAGRQDQAGLLQEGRRRHPADRSEDAGVRAAEEAALRLHRRDPRRRRRRREDAAHGRRQRSRRRAGAHRAVRNADLLGQPPGRDRRQRGRHRPRAALGLRLGARAVRDLGRAGRQGDGREDGGRRLHRARAGSASRSPRRAKACASIGRRQDRASRASSASAAASRRSRPTRARCRSTRSAPPAARWSATAARRSSTSATASSASSSTPR